MANAAVQVPQLMAARKGDSPLQVRALAGARVLGDKSCNAETHRLVFVTGFHHSGTTVLQHQASCA